MDNNTEFSTHRCTPTFVCENKPCPIDMQLEELLESQGILDQTAHHLEALAELSPAMKIAAQVACEAILNHPNDGWEDPTMISVLEAARAIGVAAFYTDSLAELVAAGVPCASCEVRPAGFGHFGSYCSTCSELPYGS